MLRFNRAIEFGATAMLLASACGPVTPPARPNPTVESILPTQLPKPIDNLQEIPFVISDWRPLINTASGLAKANPKDLGDLATMSTQINNLLHDSLLHVYPKPTNESPTAFDLQAGFIRDPILQRFTKASIFLYLQPSVFSLVPEDQVINMSSVLRTHSWAQNIYQTKVDQFPFSSDQIYSAGKEEQQATKEDLDLVSNFEFCRIYRGITAINPTFRTTLPFGNSDLCLGYDKTIQSPDPTEHTAYNQFFKDAFLKYRTENN